jgi:hypothetical protein
VPLPWLDIPWMRALHGTANALGFTVPALVGWYVQQQHVSHDRIDQSIPELTRWN